MTPEKLRKRVSYRQKTRDYRHGDTGRAFPLSRSVRVKGLLPLQSHTAWRHVGNRLLRRLARGEAFIAPEQIEQAIDAQKGHGKPLELPVRTKMEKAFGTDFSQVRVHDHSTSATLNEALASRAFTTGHDIFFGAGEYAPESAEGQRLLAHELAHVVQQQDGMAYLVGSSQDPAEREAEAMAQAALQALPRLERETIEDEEAEEEEVQTLRRQPEEDEEEALS